MSNAVASSAFAPTHRQPQLQQPQLQQPQPQTQHPQQQQPHQQQVKPFVVEQDATLPIDFSFNTWQYGEEASLYSIAEDSREDRASETPSNPPLPRGIQTTTSLSNGNRNYNNDFNTDDDDYDDLSSCGASSWADFDKSNSSANNNNKIIIKNSNNNITSTISKTNRAVNVNSKITNASHNHNHNHNNAWMSLAPDKINQTDIMSFSDDTAGGHSRNSNSHNYYGNHNPWRYRFAALAVVVCVAVFGAVIAVAMLVSSSGSSSSTNNPSPLDGGDQHGTLRPVPTHTPSHAPTRAPVAIPDHPASTKQPSTIAPTVTPTHPSTRQPVSASPSSKPVKATTEPTAVVSTPAPTRALVLPSPSPTTTTAVPSPNAAYQLAEATVMAAVQNCTNSSLLLNQSTTQGRVFQALVTELYQAVTRTSNGSFQFPIDMGSGYFKEKFALEMLYDATYGSNWTVNTNWQTPTDPCDGWYGVINCQVRQNGNCGVLYLNLNSNNLAGALPSEICCLPCVLYVSLSSNNIGGQIPSCLATMPSQPTFALAGNHFNT